MALNKQIIQKIVEKTKENEELQEFILNVLQEENRGIGWFKKYYKEEIDKGIVEEEKNEN